MFLTDKNVLYGISFESISAYYVRVGGRRFTGRREDRSFLRELGTRVERNKRVGVIFVGGSLSP